MRALLDPTTPAGAALRTTLAAVLAMALALALHVEVPALAVVFVLARGSAGAVTMLAGGAAGAAAGIVLLANFDQSRLALSLALFGLTAVATYASLGRRFPYAFVQLQLALLILVGQALDTPEQAVRHAFYDLANVAIAAFAGFVANASQPVAVPERLRRTLAAALTGMAALHDRAARDGASVRLELLGRRARGLLAQAWPTRRTSRARRRALGIATAAVDELQRALQALLAVARALPRRDAAEALHAATALGGCAARLAPLLAPPADGVARPTLRDEARDVALAARRAAAVLEERAPVAAGLAAAVRDAAVRLALVAPLLAPGAATRERVAAIDGPAARGSSPEERTPLDRYRLRHAVKTAAAYQLVLWAWVASDWGAIVPAFVVSVLVATLATPLGATLVKAALRVGGVLVGGLAGLAISIVLLPYVTELWSMCALVAIPLFLFLWLQERSERLAFASLQAAIALSLTLVEGPAPSPTWRAPLENLIGLAFGITVVVAVMHAVWPIDAASSTHRTLARLLERSGRRLGALVASHAGADERAAMLLEREHAAGFAHEVALYGEQFGRPAEHLARLVRLVCELDALARTLVPLAETSAAPLADDVTGELTTAGGALAAACGAVAGELAALPGERDPEPADETLRSLRASRAALAARTRERADPRVAAALAAAAATAEVLDQVRTALATPVHRRLVARRAA